MIIFRYLLREVLKTFVVISLILLIIFISNQFARYLSLTAAGKLVGTQLVHLILLEIPQLLSLIFPLALYLSILLSYGRLYADHEMVVLSACGVSERRLLGYTLLISVLVVIPVMIFTLWLNPLIAGTRDRLLSQVKATSALQFLMPERFQQANHGQLIFYIEKMSDDRQRLKNVFIARQADTNNSTQGDLWTVMSAEGGHYFIDPTTKDRFVVADNGYRYEGVPGSKKFTLYHFSQYGVRIDIPVPFIRGDNIDSISTSQLWQEARKHKPEANAELQWRLSIPLCIFVLALIAFSLSRVAPRQGRFGKLFPAILLYVIYANFLILAQTWVSNSVLVPVLGLWVIHGLMLLLGLLLFAKQTGYWQKWQARFIKAQ